jgi:uridylate kinase
VSPEEVALARQALRSAEGCARRLARSHGKLSGQFLLSAARVTALPPDVEDDLDAFLKRYEQLINAIQDELFKVVAIGGGEDVRGLARREVAELMARLGALLSAESFRLVAIRNRIAHSYPDDPGRQATNLNAAYETVPDLLAAHDGVRRYLERRLPEE